MRHYLLAVVVLPALMLGSASISSSEAGLPSPELTNATTNLVAAQCQSCQPKRGGPIRRFERWKWSKIRSVFNRGGC